jgi:hypothetical protein
MDEHAVVKATQIVNGTLRNHGCNSNLAARGAITSGFNALPVPIANADAPPGTAAVPDAAAEATLHTRSGTAGCVTCPMLTA